MIEDQTAAYILATRKPFEDLRQVTAQLAGLLVLKATPDHPLHVEARRLYREASDGLRASQSTPHASRHQSHLRKAAAELQAALNLPLHSDAMLAHVRLAYEELQSASRTLPGFEMVAFEQGCCSALANI